MFGTTRTIKNIVDTGTGQILCNSVEILTCEVHSCFEAKPRFISEKCWIIVKNVTVVKLNPK